MLRALVVNSAEPMSQCQIKRKRKLISGLDSCCFNLLFATVPLKTWRGGWRAGEGGQGGGGAERCARCAA